MRYNFARGSVQLREILKCDIAPKTRITTTHNLFYHLEVIC